MGKLDAEFGEPLDYLPRMPKDRSLRIGCIGAGFIMADCHLVAYRKAGFEIAAIASRSMERATEVANRHCIPKVHATWQELVADRSLDVIDVAVPPDRQAEILRQIANLVRGQ